MIKVLVLIDSSNEFSRRFLTGLIRYSNEHGPWIFHRLPAYYKSLYGESGILERIKEWEIDAIVSQWEYEEINFLFKIDIPVFLQSYIEQSSNFSKISGDYVGVGIMAADFFADRKFRNFAYYGHKDFYWSKARGEGFRSKVEKIGGNFFSFESELLNNLQWSESHVLLDKWLVSLPKPVALFTCDDIFALQVSEMCKVNNINIPNELSLLGVDNDELMCKLSYPSISSIVTDDEGGGYNTGRMLHKQIINKKNEPFNIFINPVRIELRQSTEKYDIENKDVLKVVNYIEKNITSPIFINYLTELVPLSRRNLEIKFKDSMGTSIYQFILKKKIDHISEQLLTTDKSLLDIAIESGFNDVRNIYRIFKTHTGYTPIEYRKKQLDNK